MGSLFSYLFGWQTAEPAYDLTPDPTTGLNERDRKLILETWELVADRKTIKDNGVEFFLQLFEAHPHMQEYFPLFRGKELSELRTSPKMRAHATSVMYALTSYMEMVDDPETLVGLIQKISYSHINRNIKGEDFDKLNVVFVNFMKSYLGKRCTPEIEEAWTKLLGAHSAVYKQCEEEMKKDKESEKSGTY